MRGMRSIPTLLAQVAASQATATTPDTECVVLSLKLYVIDKKVNKHDTIKYSHAWGVDGDKENT